MLREKREAFRPQGLRATLQRWPVRPITIKICPQYGARDSRGKRGTHSGCAHRRVVPTRVLATKLGARANNFIAYCTRPTTSLFLLRDPKAVDLVRSTEDHARTWGPGSVPRREIYQQQSNLHWRPTLFPMHRWNVAPMQHPHAGPSWIAGCHLPVSFGATRRYHINFWYPFNRLRLPDVGLCARRELPLTIDHHLHLRKTTSYGRRH